MTKNKKRLMYGFSIAELLLSILIAAVIAAAMVPVVGPKKIKAPLTRFNHGMAQCYYVAVNEDGTQAQPHPETGDYPNNTHYQLYYFYTDNNPNNPENGAPRPVNDNYCTFSTPNADFYEVIAIGAGGDGSISNAFTVTLGGQSGVVGSGSIHGDSRYQTDINNATIFNRISIASKLRTMLEQWADPENNDLPAEVRNRLYALYELESPLGQGGTGQCKRQIISPSKMPSCLSRCRSFDDDNCTGPYRYNTLYYYAYQDENGNLVNYPSIFNGENGQEPIRSNIAINNSFYSDDEVAFALDNDDVYDGRCWYYQHAMGYPSGWGIKIDRNNTPAKFFLDGWTNIELTQAEEKTEVRQTTSKDPEFEAFARLSASGAGDSPYMQSGMFVMPAYQRPEDATCEERNLASPVCAEAQETLTAQNPGAPGGIESGALCTPQYSEPVNGIVTLLCERGNGTYDDIQNCGYGYPAGADHTILLGWEYRGRSLTVRHALGGSPGREEIMVFENINPGKKLYMYPSMTARTDNFFQGRSYVSTMAGHNANSYANRFIAAEPGILNGLDNSQIALFSTDLPIPERTYSIAVPDNRGYFKYLSKIEGVNTNNSNAGLKSCTDNVCPGFAGNGVYPMFDSAPTGYGITIKNYTNGAEFSGVSDEEEADGEVLQNLQCRDGRQWFISQNIDYGGGHLGTAYACRAKRTKGNPGAVIIVW